MNTDHLEEAVASLRYAESDDAGEVEAAQSTQQAIAHALIQIAQDLRWFREQRESDGVIEELRR